MPSVPEPQTDAPSARAPKVGLSASSVKLPKTPYFGNYLPHFMQTLDFVRHNPEGAICKTHSNHIKSSDLANIAEFNGLISPKRRGRPGHQSIQLFLLR
jgi:hypothetical protein